MNRDNDLEYFRQRVIIERQRATTAPSIKIAMLHMQLADLYEEMVEAKTVGPVQVWPPDTKEQV